MKPALSVMHAKAYNWTNQVILKVCRLLQKSIVIKKIICTTLS